MHLNSGSTPVMVEPTDDTRGSGDGDEENIGFESIVFLIANVLLSGVLCALFILLYLRAETQLNQVLLAIAIAFNGAWLLVILAAGVYRVITALIRGIRNSRTERDRGNTEPV
jgi:hypothetical protein